MTSGGLVFEGPGQPFVDAGLTADASGLFAVGADYHFQFMHMLPALEATGHTIAGDVGPTRVPALLAGLGLMSAFALATTLARPAFALAATSALGLKPRVHVYHSRFVQ